jgi:chaperonin GroES
MEAKTFENRGSVSIDKSIMPLQDNVVLEMIATAEKVLESGIIIPNSDGIERKSPNKGKPLFGRVVAVGPGKVSKKGILIKPEIEIGEIVFINEWGGTKVMVGEKEYLVIRENEALFTTDKI